ncbi:hypothetical protein DdX_19952 [Ditylenchus destructor]|uniref:Uncharacterized protein n=1 Tax=Ditylenchus destructor TaxID=166010 RepID=A0AAD4MGZ7_9BILA|nr:hypothetical protein DdX_19952 [Ditylenchus destructor]
MEKNRGVIRELLKFEFELGHSAKEAMDNINRAKGAGTVAQSPFPRLASFPPCTLQQRSLQQRNFSSPEWMFQTMPSFFNSPSCSPQGSGDSQALSPKVENVPPDFNLNNVVSSISSSQQHLEEPKKPWMDGYWRSGHLASDKHNANGFLKEEYGNSADGSGHENKLFSGDQRKGSDIQDGALTCSGCGNRECRKRRFQ